MPGPAGRMTDIETLAERVRTVERAVGDGNHAFPGVEDVSALESRLDELESRLDDLEAQADELDAATQAVRGYVGNVRSVNTEVERRADAALAATDRLERRLDELADRGGCEPAQTHTGREHEATDTGDTRPACEGAAWEQNQQVDGLVGEGRDGTGDGRDDESRPSGLTARVRALL